jgi:hypothetical protein
MMSPWMSARTRRRKAPAVNRRPDAFPPLLDRVQRFANRLVYGRGATPYQVLSRFVEQVAGTYATDEIGSAIARLLLEGTGAERAEIWLRRDGEPWLEARWPAGDAMRAAEMSPSRSVCEVEPVRSTNAMPRRVLAPVGASPARSRATSMFSMASSRR